MSAENNALTEEKDGQTQLQPHETAITTPPKKPLERPKKKKFVQRPLFYVLIALAAVVVVLVVWVVGNIQNAIQANASPKGNTVAVEQRALLSDILTSGTLKSKDVKKIYAPSALKVKTIIKDVGDAIQPGEPLAELDTYQLEMDIKQLELNIANIENGLSTEELSIKNGTQSASSNVSSAKIQVDQAQRDYDKLLSQDGGSTVRNAEIALEDARKAYNDALNPASTLYNAQLDYDSARSKYDKAVRDRNDAYDAMQSAESKLNAANRANPSDPAAVTKAETEYNTAQSTYNKLNDSMPDAQIAMEKARVAFDNTHKNVDDAVITKQEALEKAQMAYDDAVRNASESLRLAEEKLKNAKLSQRNASDSLALAKNKDAVSTQTNLEVQRLNLESKRKQLGEAALNAPSKGVVTYANLSVGAVANGLMYVVEDVESLIIATTVGEYDIDNVRLGQRVIIKTDSTGNDEFIGEVTFISPTAQKSAAGETQSTNSVKFDVEITVTHFDARLKIGMNATASIITNEKENALAVPFDAVYERDGEKYVVVIDENNAIREIPVEIGIETDAFTEVISTELHSGMRAILNLEGTESLEQMQQQYLNDRGM